MNVKLLRNVKLVDETKEPQDKPVGDDKHRLQFFKWSTTNKHNSYFNDELLKGIKPNVPDCLKGRKHESEGPIPSLSEMKQRIKDET